MINDHMPSLYKHRKFYPSSASSSMLTDWNMLETNYVVAIRLHAAICATLKGMTSGHIVFSAFSARFNFCDALRHLLFVCNKTYAVISQPTGLTDAAWGADGNALQLQPLKPLSSLLKTHVRVGEIWLCNVRRALLFQPIYKYG